MDKDRTAAIAARGGQIKTNTAEHLWVCRGIKPLPVPDKPVATDPNLGPNMRNEAIIVKMKHDLPHIDRWFDIDEPTNDTPPKRQSGAQRGAFEYGKRVDAHRLAAVSAGGGWWNPTTQELIPILPEDHPDYRQNREIITEAIRRWDRGTSR